MRKALAVTGALAVLAPLAWAPAAEARDTRCRPKGSETVAASTRVRIYYVTRGGTDRTVACVLRTGRRTVLGEVYARESFGLSIVRFDGWFVAFGFQGCTGPFCGAGVGSVDVRSGSTMRRCCWLDPPTDLVLKSNGSIAWIVRDPFATSARVQKLDAAGYQELDSGPIDPTSLALSRSSQVYWTNAGVARSAPLE